MAILAALTLLAQAQGIQPAEDAYAEAVRLLAQDRASEAEAAARRALAESSLFLPEREIGSWGYELRASGHRPRKQGRGHRTSGHGELIVGSGIRVWGA